MEILNSISEALQRGDREKVRSLTQEALESKIPPSQILEEGLIAGMDITGEKFKRGEIYIPEVLIIARAMHSGLDILKPALAERGAQPVGKFIIGTVKGDYHDIGKNLVIMMIQGKGFEVVDLGMDVPTERFVDAVQNEKVNIIGMSALLSTTRPSMEETIEALKNAGLRDRVKIMVGGGAVTERFADEIGADAFGQDAATAAELAISLLG
jgi:5-methyltetrahydrofolate--homocysteine methyltransferase